NVTGVQTCALPILPYDQREDDGGSLVFDTDEFTETTEILGSAVVELELASTEPVAMVAARLSDVAPDGSVTRISYGLLNLTHRDSHAAPEPLVPGERYVVQVKLNGAAQQIPVAHRLRVATSTSYWPFAWPPPRPVRLTSLPRRSRLLLTDRISGDDGDARLRA